MMLKAKLLALLILISFSGLATAFDKEVNYSERMQMIQELGRKYPGHIAAVGMEDWGLGLMGGIMIQTRWQVKTKRHVLPFWHRINYMLTVAPYEFSKNMKKSCRQNSFVKKYTLSNESEAPSNLVETCKAWRKYYKDAKKYHSDNTLFIGIFDGNENKKKHLSKLLWEAHGESIRYAIWRFGNEMKLGDNDEEEWNFWANWTAFVFYLEEINLVTNDINISPIKNSLMPNCYPISEKSCRHSMTVLQESYLSIFTKSGVTIRDLLYRSYNPGYRSHLSFDILRMIF